MEKSQKSQNGYMWAKSDQEFQIAANLKNDNSKEISQWNKHFLLLWKTG